MTKNPNHPAKGVRHERLAVLEYEGEIDFADLFEKLRGRYGVERVTIQSGGQPERRLAEGRPDRRAVGRRRAGFGRRPGDPDADRRPGAWSKNPNWPDVKALKLRRAEVLENSYLHLFYEVVRETRIV